MTPPFRWPGWTPKTANFVRTRRQMRGNHRNNNNNAALPPSKHCNEAYTEGEEGKIHDYSIMWRPPNLYKAGPCLATCEPRQRHKQKNKCPDMHSPKHCPTKRTQEKVLQTGCPCRTAEKREGYIDTTSKPTLREGHSEKTNWYWAPEAIEQKNKNSSFRKKDQESDEDAQTDDNTKNHARPLSQNPTYLALLLKLDWQIPKHRTEQDQVLMKWPGVACGSLPTLTLYIVDRHRKDPGHPSGLQPPSMSQLTSNKRQVK